jgi:choline dehydrogenase
VRHALPAVGQDLVDHPLCPVVFTCRASVSLKSAERPGQLLRYLPTRRGMLTSNVGEALALLGDLEVIFAPVTWLGQGLEPPRVHGPRSA